jgi:predicted dehydrogenase
MKDRILIVGYGNAGKRYHKIIKKFYPNYTLRIFSISNIKKKKNFFLKNNKEIIDFKPNLSILANPSSLRLKFCKLLFDLNSHLLIEKPLSSELRQAENIIKLFKKKNLIIKIGYNLRFLNSVQKLKEIIKNKKIGRILFGRVEVGEYLPDWRNTLYKNSVSSQKRFGGGVLLELSHEIDYLLYLLGDFDKVFCKIQKTSDLKIDVEDLGNLILHNKKKFYINVSLDFCRRDRVRKFYISGKKGSIELNFLTNNIRHYNNKWKKISIPKESIKKTYKKVFDEFIKITKKNKHNFIKKKPKLATLKDGQKVLKIIMAARKSSKTNKIIKLN